MNRKYLIDVLIGMSILISVLGIFTFDLMSDNKIAPKAINGAIDLSQWDFKKQGYVSLDGEWSFSSDLEKSQSSVIVPSYLGGGITEATYSLKIMLPEEQKGSLDLYIPHLYSSYQLSINDNIAVQNGYYADDNGLDWKKVIVSTLIDRNIIKLSILVRNKEYMSIGIAHSIALGTKQSISKLDNIDLSKDLACAIIFILIGFFHFAFIRKGDTAPFWMGVYCIQIAIYGLTFYERSFFSLFDFSWIWIHKIQFISLYTCLISFHFYLKNSYFGVLNELIAKALIAITSIQILVILFIPGLLYADLFMYVFGPSMLVVCANAIYVFYVEAKNKSLYAGLNLTGFTVLSIFSFNDFLNHNGIIVTTPWVSTGLLFYLSLQAVMVKNRYRDSFNNTELLNIELKNNVTKLVSANKLIEEKMAEVSIAREDADRALVSKTQFLALISHELRTPITSSYQLIESLEDMTINNSRAKSFIRLSLDTMEPVFNLLEDIIDFSTIEYNKKLKIASFPFCLDKLARGVYLTLGRLASNKSITMELDQNTLALDDDDLILSDQTRIRQILTNFITNAIKYTHKNGHINIHYRVQESRRDDKYTHLMVLEVTDNGIGIAESDQGHIFEMFRQLDIEGSGHNMEQGFGLGLALCKVIIDEMGGHISVRSKVNQGSTFTAEIPVFLSKKQEPTLPLDEEEMSNIHILLVEDDPSIQYSTSTLLRNVGVSVDVASNADEALKLVKSNNYDLAFVDCYLPGVNGFELTRNIRAWESTSLTSNMIIIGQSASPQQDVVDSAMDSGMSDFMSKPYKKIDLYRKIHWHKNWNSEISKALN